MKKVLSLGLAGIATAAIGVLAPATTAHAAAACTTVLSGVPASVSINETWEWVPWRLTVTNPTAPALYAVGMENRDTSEFVDGDFPYVDARLPSGSAAGAFKLDAWHDAGWYRVGTENYGCGNAPNVWVKVKFAGGAKTYASRSGSSVTVTGASYQYAYYDGYQRKAGVPVKIQRYVAGVWTTIKSGTTGSKGTLSVTVKSSKASAYRTIVAPTATAWGTTSARVTK